MNDTAASLKDLTARAAGKWAGTESMIVDPASGQRMQTKAALTNSLCLGGRGFTSDYVQRSNGAETMRCLTSFRFDEDDQLVAVWTPGQGESQQYSGTRDGYLFSMSAQNSDGSIQTIQSDYSQPNKFSTKTLIGIPGQDDLLVFEGEYHSADADTGRPMWRDLTVEDAAALLPFYETVIGWKSEAVDMGEATDFNLITESGEVAAGLCHAVPPNDGLPTYWLNYFEVSSADEAASQAASLGGSVIAGPKAFANYRYFVIEDPQGAVFAACEIVQ